MTVKIPRKGTRVRALLDRLCDDYMNGRLTSWSAAKGVYDDYVNEDNGLERKSNWSRKYSSMDVSRYLKKYADRRVHGDYSIKPEYVSAMIAASTGSTTKYTVIGNEKWNFSADIAQSVDIDSRESMANDLIAKLIQSDEDHVMYASTGDRMIVATKHIMLRGEVIIDIDDCIVTRRKSVTYKIERT